MPDRPTAGARVRIVIESTIESLDSGDMHLTNGVQITQYDLTQMDLTVIEPGWQPGDAVNDGHSNLVRIRRDRGDLWMRPDGTPVYDDETSLASLTVVHRADDRRRSRAHGITTLANPHQVCGECRKPVTGFHYQGACGCGESSTWNDPCGHNARFTSICPTWEPDGGCQCEEQLGNVDHPPAPEKASTEVQ